MQAESSIRFFDAQFQRQVEAGDLRLNPFEELALPYLAGRVLDFGCGLGNLSVAAARQGCTVLALDASTTAIEHLRKLAAEQGLAIEAQEADLRSYALQGEFDTVVCIGLLMFFDCATAAQRLADLQAHLRPGGVAIVNVLVQGTSYMDMFDPSGHCLFTRDELAGHFAGWEILRLAHDDFPAPGDTRKSFDTLIARKPL